MLLEAGANPDDGESVYHATEAPTPSACALLLEHGATVEPIALAHALDDERLEHVRLLLDAGADARELLPFAVRRGRGPEYLRLLVEHGAELEHRSGEGWRHPTRIRTAYQHAVLRGADESAALLASLGAETTVEADDLAIAAVARGERPGGLPSTLDHDQQEVVILAAVDGRMPLVVELFGPNFRGVIGGSPEGSLLQHASWVADSSLVDLLLAAGADPRGALDWTAHGSQSHETGRNYVGVAERLIAAGAVIYAEVSWRWPTVRWPSGSEHDSHAEPEGHVIGPLPPLRQRSDRRKQRAEQGAPCSKSASPAAQRGQRLPPGGGSSAPNMPAQPSDRAKWTGAPAASSTSVRSSCGSTTRPAAPVRPRPDPRAGRASTASREPRRRPRRPRRRPGRQAGTAAHGHNLEGRCRQAVASAAMVTSSRSAAAR